GVITGSAPLLLNVIEEGLLVNGDPSALVTVQNFPGSPDPGWVCLAIETSADFVPPANASYAIVLEVTNLQQQTGGRVPVPLDNTRGLEFDPDDGVQVDACRDDNVTPPVANAGSNRNVADTNQVAGERVTLDGSASYDPDGVP